MKTLVICLLCALLSAGSVMALQYAQNGTGVFANKIGWFNFAGYVHATASSAGGQNFSYTLADGSTLSFNLRRTGPERFDPAAVPVLPDVAFGNVSYAGIDSGGTKTALFDTTGEGNATFVMSNIVLTAPDSSQSRQFRLVTTDAERTTSPQNESYTWTTNGPIWTRIETFDAPTSPGGPANPMSGLGTSSVMETGVPQPPPFPGSFILIAAQPAAAQSPMSVTLGTHSNRQAFAFGLALPQIDLGKSTTSGSVAPDGTITYTIVVQNIGLVTANGTRVVDPIPAGLDSFTWTCAGAAGGVCPNSSGAGAIDETVATLLPGGSVTYTVTAQVSSNPPDAVTNTAGARPPPGGVCGDAHTAPPCTSTVIVSSSPVVSLTKSTTATAFSPGGTIVYTLTATNVGSAAASNTLVSDPIPSGISALSWTCAASGGAACPAASGSGAISQTIATFPAGGAVVYTISATVSATPPASIINTGTANVPGGLCAPGNTPPPCTASVPLPSVPIIQISKTADPATPSPAGTLTYTVTVTNTGTLDASGTTLSDPVPAGLTTFDWTCAPAGSAVCPNDSGSGAINETIATFPSGSAVIYTITATLSSTPPASILNTASATPPAGGLCEPGNTSPPCTAAVTTTPAPVVSITKSVNVTTITPGGTAIYTITATNTGSSAAGGTVIGDAVPSGFASFNWSCAAGGGAVCPNASGSGTINETIATFPAGGSVTYTVTAVFSATPPAQIVNNATATPPSGGLCAPGNTPPPCSGTSVLPSAPELQILKTADSQDAAPGGTIGFTVVVTDITTVNANGTTIADPLPPGFTAFAWTCSASGGAVCPNASGSGSINETVATFPGGGSLTYHIAATVSSTPPASMINIASTTPPGNGLCAPSSSPPPCTAAVVITSVPVVSVTKSVDVSTIEPGGTAVYTITVTNSGSTAAGGTLINDALPDGIASFAWSCAAAGGAVCPNASGSGALGETIATFPAGASVTYTVTATAAASSLPSQIVNNVAATPPPDGLCGPGNTAPPCTATATLDTPVPEDVPALSWQLLLALVALLAGVAVARMARPD